MRGLGLTVNRPLYELGAADVACLVGTMTEDDMALVGTSRAVMLDALAAEIDYVSLHTADPGATGTSEVSGGSYARVASSWGSATASSLTLASTDFTTPAGTFTHVGFWSASSGGTFFGSAQIANPKPRGAGTFTLPACRVYLDAGDIYVDQGSSDTFRLVLHNTGLLQAPLRIDPDTVLLLDPADYDDVQRFCPTSHTGWDQGGNGGLSAVGVANGANASAGPIFATDQYGQCVTLKQTVAAAYVSATVPALSTADAWTLEAMYRGPMAPSSDVLLASFSGGAYVQLESTGHITFYDGSAADTSSSTVATLLSISTSWDRFQWRAVPNGTSLDIDVRVPGGSWTAAVSAATISAVSPATQTLYVGSSSTTKGLIGVVSSFVLRDGDGDAAIVASLPVDPAAYDTLADGGVATDAYDNEWEITRPAADTSAARVLPARDVQYISLPGVSGEYVSVPDSAANSITGDLAIKFVGTAVDWSPTSQQCLISKSTFVSDQRSVLFNLLTSGALQLAISSAGTSGSITYITTTALVPASATGVGVEFNSTNGAATFYTTADNGATWDVLQSYASTLATSGLFDSSAPWEVGSVNGGGSTPFAGDVSWVEIYSGDFDGTLVERIDAADAPLTGTTWTSPTSGATITLNRSASAQYHAKVMPANTVVLQGDGVNDYLQVVGDDSITDFDPSVGLTLLIDGSVPVADSGGVFASSANATTDDGVIVSMNSTNPRIQGRADDGTTVATVGDNADNISFGSRFQAAFAFGSSDHEAYVDGVSVEAATDAVTAETAAGALRFFAEIDGSNPLAADLYGAAIIRRRINDAAADTIATEGLLA